MISTFLRMVMRLAWQGGSGVCRYRLTGHGPRIPSAIRFRAGGVRAEHPVGSVAHAVSWNRSNQTREGHASPSFSAPALADYSVPPLT